MTPCTKVVFFFFFFFCNDRIQEYIKSALWNMCTMNTLINTFQQRSYIKCRFYYFVRFRRCRHRHRGWTDFPTFRENPWSHSLQALSLPDWHMYRKNFFAAIMLTLGQGHATTEALEILCRPVPAKIWEPLIQSLQNLAAIYLPYSCFSLSVICGEFSGKCLDKRFTKKKMLQTY